MSYLVDTNILLEILLRQPKGQKCQEFLLANAGNLVVSDFSLHSIGVVTFRAKREDLFSRFLTDLLPGMELLGLDIVGHAAIPTAGTFNWISTTPTS
jgi:predicted nucleic acid-binding protein